MVESNSKVSVLFVCMGNICRSPTAEAVLRHLAAEAGVAESLSIDSAGTHAYHVGAAPDARSRAAAARRGYSLDAIRARKVVEADFKRFDLILAMDRLNLETLRAASNASQHAKLKLFLQYARSQELDVPDPYYGGATGFERVLDLVEDASRTLLAEIRRGLLH